MGATSPGAESECRNTTKTGESKMDFNLSLRRAIKTGKVVLGQNSVEKIVAENKAELIIVAKNVPTKVQRMIAAVENLPLYEFNGSSRQLGKECGRDHMISVLAIVDAGESDILSLKRA
jgi:large subunit ribosomal protein L30e